MVEVIEQRNIHIEQVIAIKHFSRLFSGFSLTEQFEESLIKYRNLIRFEDNTGLSNLSSSEFNSNHTNYLEIGKLFE